MDKEFIENPVEAYEKLKQENEKLKEFQKLLEEQMAFNKSELEWSLSSEIKRSEILLKAFKKADKQKDNWREKAEKLLKTLTEIKEIAEKSELYLNIEEVKTATDLEYDYAGKIWDLEQRIHKILQKISEVEDDNA